MIQRASNLVIPMSYFFQIIVGFEDIFSLGFDAFKYTWIVFLFSGDSHFAESLCSMIANFLRIHDLSLQLSFGHHHNMHRVLNMEASNARLLSWQK
jgi:hypothetical protein